MKVLIADDNRDIAEIVEISVQMNWPDCAVFIAADGAEALEIFLREDPDMVILDIEMPPPDGQEVCKLIRKQSEVPIVMLSARQSTAEKVRALDSGADDYVTKPFDALEFLARLRSAVRRRHSVPEDSAVYVASAAEAEGVDEMKIKAGDLVLCVDSRQVIIDGERVQLTSTESRLLAELMRHPGHLMPYRLLLDNVWGPEYEDADRYLKVFVWRLRHKLGEKAKHRQYIHNEWGVGYRFATS